MLFLLSFYCLFNLYYIV